MPELQTVPARHGVATFVPAGQTIKIVNSSGSQVVDTWAFALPSPDIKNGEEQRQGEGQPEQNGQKPDQSQQEQPQQKAEEEKPVRPTPKKSRKSGMNLPSQEEAEKATKEGLEKEQQTQQQQQQQQQQGQQGQQKKNTWSSYVPSIGWSSKNGAKQGEQPQQGETEKQKNSRTWGSYIPSGKAYSNYIPKSASDTVASLASSHQRDPNKSYVQQLKDFSQTPVGAAGIKAISGSGYSGSLYAGYQAWNAMNAPDAPPMEFLSMPHTRSSTLHMVPKVNDLFLSNLREPMMTLVEDTSSGNCHDTLIAACDPVRYRQLGVEHWEEHGSCAENLVLALKELNERAGLKGAKGVGAEVTINNVPAPLNLFMNVPWDEQGDLNFKSPKTKAGDFVRLRAERDVVVVLSSCPMDVTDINGKKIDDAHFLVEGGEDEEAEKKQRKTVPRRRPAPRKINSNRAPSTVATGEMGDDDKSQIGSTPAKKTVPARRTAPAKRTTQSQASQGAAPAKKSAAAPKKKPIPRPAGTPANVNESATNGSATPTDSKPVEKKKPRKLVRPQAAGAQKAGE